MASPGDPCLSFPSLQHVRLRPVDSPSPLFAPLVLRRRYSSVLFHLSLPSERLPFTPATSFSLVLHPHCHGNQAAAAPTSSIRIQGQQQELQTGLHQFFSLTPPPPFPLHTAKRFLVRLHSSSIFTLPRSDRCRFLCPVAKVKLALDISWFLKADVRCFYELSSCGQT